jgi:HSP20 family protein
MTESNDKKLTVLTALVVILLVAVVAQSVVMFGLRKEIGKGSTGRDQSLVTAAEDEQNEKGSSPALTMPDDPFKDEPLDWDLDDWDPFKEMHSLQDRINQMFGGAFNRFERSDDFGTLFGEHPFAPAIDIEDKVDHYLVTVDLPGAEDSRVDVNIDGQTLTISGSVREEVKEEDEGKVLKRERRTGRFRRAVTLPSPVKADEMTTEHRKGVLYINIPKKTAEE